jgi:pantothenate kinase
MCKLENIVFDTANRKGSSFIMYDSLQSAFVGMMTIGVHRKAAIQCMIEGLAFLVNQAGVIPESIVLSKGQDSIQIHDVMATVRAINRAVEKASTKGSQ